MHFYTYLVFIIGVAFAVFTDKLIPEQRINNQLNKSFKSKTIKFKNFVKIY